MTENWLIVTASLQTLDQECISNTLINEDYLPMNTLPHTMLFTSNLNEVLGGLTHSDGCVSQDIKLADLVLSARTARLVDVLSALFGELLEAGMTRQELLKCFEETAIRFGFEDDVFFAKHKKSKPESAPTDGDDAPPAA